MPVSSSVSSLAQPVKSKPPGRCFDLINGDATFYSANDDDSTAYYAFTISLPLLSVRVRWCSGRHPIAYLIAPPMEAQYGMDAALKAADVRMCCYFEPPSRRTSVVVILLVLSLPAKLPAMHLRTRLFTATQSFEY
jgi:ethanolamine utilization microcompartment shell protein EutL